MRGALLAARRLPALLPHKPQAIALLRTSPAQHPQIGIPLALLAPSCRALAHSHSLGSGAAVRSGLWSRHRAGPGPLTSSKAAAPRLVPRSLAPAPGQVRTMASLTAGTAGTAPDIYTMGPGTLSINRTTLHRATRAKLLAKINDSGIEASKRGVALLQGGGAFHVYSTDGEMLFKQESYMFYLFGVTEDGWYGALDLNTGRSTLFMPRLPEAYAVWMGALKSPEQYKAQYGVDEVKYVDELHTWMKAAAPKCINVLHGTNTDSGSDVKGPSFEGMDEFEIEKSVLWRALTECRVTKLPEEVEIIRYANQLAGAAHVQVMQACKPGVMEYQLESVFLHHCYSKGGSRRAMYTPILASGLNAAILHYGHAGAPNDRMIGGSELVLADLGCEYYGYGSDITTTWPSDGKFTPFQRSIYEAVLSAFNAVKQAMKPGVAWPDMHLLANRKILEGLLAAGLVKGDVDAMLEADIGALFMPHGLGHFLGLDTHDVGGYMPDTPPRIMRPGFKSLRTARVLEPGMVITVEPGCYFNPALLLPALQDPAKSQFLSSDVAKASGGVRIEDNVLVTADGAESLTRVPRTVEEIERVMAGAPWP